MIVYVHHYVSEHYKWLFGDKNKHLVYRITRIEAVRMQATSIINIWISCKCSRVWFEKATVGIMH